MLHLVVHIVERDIIKTCVNGIFRSAYFQQIEEDVEKYGATIKKMQATLTSFQTKDMDELRKFHRELESTLEVLTDESQVQILDLLQFHF